jgi:hypothetical protein
VLRKNDSSNTKFLIKELYEPANPKTTVVPIIIQDILALIVTLDRSKNGRAIRELV